MKLSVIIPTLNEERYIASTLQSLARQTYKDFELIVKDGLSTDSTVDTAKEYADLVISKKDSSIGNARNQGVRYAKGDVLVFVDADTTLDKNALELIAEDFSLHDIVLLLPKFGPKEKDMRFLPRVKKQVSRFLVEFENYWRRYVDNFCGGMCMPVDSSTFKRIGGFDKRLRCSEDIEISYRLRKVGEVMCDYRVKAYFSIRRFILSGYVETLRNYGLNTLRMHLNLLQPEHESFR
ncbi:MAG: glycosyltransferase [Candidatus Bathyarchaeota archaeon]|jgi:glycosyltransferase involved in cell wall biosynthesis